MPRASSQLGCPRPILGIGSKGRPVLCEGAGVGAGMKDPAWVEGEEEEGAEQTWMGEPQLPSVPMGYWEAVVFLLLSSPSIASLCSQGRREEGGRASFLARQLPGARVQTYLLSWEGASLRWEGKINR